MLYIFCISTFFSNEVFDNDDIERKYEPIKTGTAANPPVAIVNAPPTSVRPPATIPEPEPMALAMVLFFVTLVTKFFRYVLQKDNTIS